MSNPARFVALVGVALLLAACSGAGGSSDLSVEGSATQTDSGGKKEPGSDRPGKNKTKKQDRDEKKNGSPGGTKGDDGGDTAPQDRQRPGGGGDSNAAAALAYPKAGSYSFDQSGYERFCQGATCDRSELPDTQALQVRYDRRSSDGAVITVEARVSSQTTNRTTYAFTRSGVWITRMETSFSQQGFDYSSAYDPKPPIRALRLPLKAGDSWSGKWDGKVSGRYQVRVVGRERISVGGRTIDAFKIEARATFSGDAEGDSAAVTWIDPSTSALVRSEGSLHAENALGTYETEFAVRLRSGPNG